MCPIMVKVVIPQTRQFVFQHVLMYYHSPQMSNKVGVEHQPEKAKQNIYIYIYTNRFASIQEKHKLFPTCFVYFCYQNLLVSFFFRCVWKRFPLNDEVNLRTWQGVAAGGGETCEGRIRGKMVIRCSSSLSTAQMFINATVTEAWWLNLHWIFICSSDKTGDLLGRCFQQPRNGLFRVTGSSWDTVMMVTFCRIY